MNNPNQWNILPALYRFNLDVHRNLLAISILYFEPFIVFFLLSCRHKRGKTKIHLLDYIIYKFVNVMFTLVPVRIIK